MSRLRILTLVSGLAIGEHYGGAERLAVEVICRLDRQRFDPSICALWRYDTPGEDEWTSRLTQSGIPVFFAGVGRANTSMPAFRQSVDRLTAHYGGAEIDVIQCHSPLAAVAALLSQAELGVRVLLRTSHTYREWGHGVIPFVCRQTFSNWIFPARFDAEVGVSRSIVANLDRRPGARILGKRALLIYNAVDLALFAQRTPDPHKRFELGLTPSDVIVGTAGRLSIEKNYELLLDAAPIVLARKPGVRFLIIGEGPLRDALCSHAERLGLSSKVVFTGARSDIADLYPLMDLFVLPSFGEGLPSVLLECMVSGIPVVATDVAGTRELVQSGQTGWLAPPGDPAALAAVILAALDDPSARADVVRRASDDAKSRFSVDQIASKYAALYSSIAGEPQEEAPEGATDAADSSAGVRRKNARTSH